LAWIIGANWRPQKTAVRHSLFDQPTYNASEVATAAV
jgi:hypothetical protein